MPGRIRIALVGVGQIATSRHLPAIRDDPRFELVALATTGGAPSAEGVAVFDDHAAMLAALPEIDAVAICTPPLVRHRIAADAIGAGRHVLLEKPVTGTLAEAIDLGRLAAGTACTVFAAWHSRFNAAVVRAGEVLRGRRVTRMDVQWREDVEAYHPGQDWIWRPGGYGVFDPGINALSIVTAIVPEPVFIQGCRMLVRPGHETPIAAALQFRSRYGGDLSASFDWRGGPNVRTIDITTQDGLALSLLDSGRRLVVDGSEVVAAGNSEYPQVYERFAALIAAGSSDFDVAPQYLVSDAWSLASRDFE